MNPLTEIIPAKARQYVYAAFALAGLVLAALQIAGVATGRTADVLSYIGIALGVTAASNTPAKTGAKPNGQAGQVDVSLLLLVLTFVGVILLLFRVHFG